MKVQNKPFYKDLDETFSIQFNALNKKLFPELKISVPNNQGIVTIKEKKFLFKVRTKKHINTFLLRDLTTALAYYKYGAESMVDLYRIELRKILTHDTKAINNLSKIVNLLYDECFNIKRQPTSYKSTLIITHKAAPIVEVDSEIDQIKEGETCHLFDFIPLLRRKTKIYLRSRVIAAAIAALFFIKNPIQGVFIDGTGTLIYNLCMRDPPLTELILNNTS